MVFLFVHSFFVFFFKQKTADEMRISDWSSDVCSSDLNFEEIENYPGFGYRWRPADEASPVADRTDRGYDAGYPMPGRVPGPARPMHNGGNDQIPTRVVDAISQLPFVERKSTRLNSSH